LNNQLSKNWIEKNGRFMSERALKQIQHHFTSSFRTGFFLTKNYRPEANAINISGLLNSKKLGNFKN